MNDFTNENAVDINSPPKGFVVKAAGGGFVEIEYRRTGMIAMNAFLIIWLSFWTVGCVFLLRSYINEGAMDDGDSTPIWFVAIFWAAEFLVAAFLLYSLFCKKMFRIDYQYLSMNVSVLGVSWNKKIGLKDIAQFQQVKDGGGQDDSFPSWGLNVVGVESQSDKSFGLIIRQPYSRSVWLGTVLSEQINVPFLQN